eukprot:scaffold73378_cov63-Phaeocystis_antarctica.AAC.9
MSSLAGSVVVTDYSLHYPLDLCATRSRLLEFVDVSSTFLKNTYQTVLLLLYIYLLPHVELQLCRGGIAQLVEVEAVDVGASAAPSVRGAHLQQHRRQPRAAGPAARRAPATAGAAQQRARLPLELMLRRRVATTLAAADHAAAISPRELEQRRLPQRGEGGGQLRGAAP